MDEIIEVIIKFIGRTIAYIFVQFIFEKLVKGAGFLIAKLIFKSNPDLEGWLVVVCGIVFWILIIIALFYSIIYFGMGANNDL